MKNNTIIYLICVCSTLNWCCTNELPCKIDKECEKIFNNQLKVLKENIFFNKTIDGNKYRAIFFFENLTQISSCANFGDVSLYDSYSDFKKDYSNWKYWFRNNHCSLTADSLQSIMDDVIKSTPWIGDIEFTSKN